MTEARPPGSRKVSGSYQRIFFSTPRRLIELDEIGAAAEQNVLAVVHHFPGAGMLVGGGASAEKGTALKQGDLKTAVGKRTAGGQPRQPAADNRNLGISVPRVRSSGQALQRSP